MLSRILNGALTARIAATAFVAFTAPACGGDGEHVARIGSAIRDAVDAGPGDDDAVVLLQNGNGAISTAALVAPNLVVTTLTAVTPWSSGAFTCTADGELENGGSGGGELGEPFDPDLIKIWIGPTTELLANPPADALGRRILGTETTSICRNDLAFVVLDRPLDGVPLLPIRLEGEVEVGDRVDIVGYGATDRNSQYWEVLGHRRRRDGMRVDDVQTPPRTFILGAGPCAGDGGGPALSSESGAIIGVFSFLSDYCDAQGTRSIYTELAPFRDLALEAFEAAGAEPWVEGTSGPGAGGDGGAGGHAGATTDPDAGGASEGGSGGHAGTPDSGAGAEPTSAGGSRGKPRLVVSRASRNESCALSSRSGHRSNRAGTLWFVLVLLVLRRSFLARTSATLAPCRAMRTIRRER